MNRRELISTMLVFLRGGTAALERELAKDAEAVNDSELLGDFTARKARLSRSDVQAVKNKMSTMCKAASVASGRG